jgi:hypothetical protein
MAMTMGVVASIELFWSNAANPAMVAAKPGHPILGVLVHGCSFLEFWTPKVPLLKSPGD